MLVLLEELPLEHLCALVAVVGHVLRAVAEVPEDRVRLGDRPAVVEHERRHAQRRVEAAQDLGAGSSGRRRRARAARAGCRGGPRGGAPCSSCPRRRSCRAASARAVTGSAGRRVSAVLQAVEGRPTQRLVDDAVALGQPEQLRRAPRRSRRCRARSAEPDRRGSRRAPPGRRRACRGSRGRPRRVTRPSRISIPSAVATAPSVTPAQATSASRSMSPEQRLRPSPPVAGWSPASASARPVCTEHVTPSPSVPVALQRDDGRLGLLAVALLQRRLHGAQRVCVHRRTIYVGQARTRSTGRRCRSLPAPSPRLAARLRSRCRHRVTAA